MQLPLIYVMILCFLRIVWSICLLPSFPSPPLPSPPLPSPPLPSAAHSSAVVGASDRLVEVDLVSNGSSGGSRNEEGGGKREGEERVRDSHFEAVCEEPVSPTASKPEKKSLTVSGQLSVIEQIVCFEALPMFLCTFINPIFSVLCKYHVKSGTVYLLLWQLSSTPLYARAAH